LNLAVNSRDAMPKGGALILKAGRGSRAGGGREATDSDMVHFTVTDTGIGMPADVLDRVFEPFFTTKDVGKGSGLGLPMVHGFANQSGGHVAVTSKPGQGTTVTVALPAAPDLQPPTEKVAAASPMRSANERILVVEDEPMLLQLVTTQLESIGYGVARAPDGAAAVAMLEADDGFDLLLTDLVLPKGMSGGDVARIARDIKPDLKVVFTSGHSMEILQQHAPQAAATPLLRKPYKRKQLADLVRNVLDGITDPLPSDDRSRG
jgi:CheY-like chemotaxis protein